MTDRIDRLIVVLEREMREDDVQALVAAIEQLRGVLRVQLGVFDVSSAICAKFTERQRIFEALMATYHETVKDEKP